MDMYVKRTLKCAAQGLSKEEAADALRQSEYFPEGTTLASFELDNDQYIATIFTPTASRPFPPDDNNDNAEDLPLPKPKADDSSKAEDTEDSGDTSDEPSKSENKRDESKLDKEPKKDGDSQVIELLLQILDRLTMSPQGAAPISKPPAAPAPGSDSNVKKVIHQRGLKPGESPPGVAPIGAPAFASKSVTTPINALGYFQASAPKGTASISDSVKELNTYFNPYGFGVSQITETADKHAALLVRQ